MRLLVASVILVLVSFTSHVPSHAEPLELTIAPQLWEFKKDGRHFYVLGSLHSVGARYFPQWVLNLIVQSAKVVFEVDVDPAKKNPAAMALPDGETLEALLSPQAWKKLMAEVSPHLGPAELAQVNQLTPLGAYFLLTESRRMFVEASSPGLQQLALFMQEVGGGMDYDIMDMARKRKIPIGALETAEEQVASMPMQVGELEALIMETPEQVRRSVETHIRGGSALMFKYFEGDIATVKQVIRDLPLEAHEAMFRDRNLAWIPKLEALPDNSFVMAGAGHLMGREGLLALMHARGWQMSRVQSCEQLLSAR